MSCFGHTTDDVFAAWLVAIAAVILVAGAAWMVFT